MTRSKAHPWRGWGLSPLAVAFFVGFFLYVHLRVEPSLEYQHSAPAFLLSDSFFKPYLTYPGGLLDYGAAFLAQLNCYNWLGALVFTLMGGLLFLSTHRVLRQVSGVTPRVVPYVPPLALLLLRDRYDLPALAIGLGLLLALGLAVACVLMPWPKTWLRLAACCLLAALLYYIAGVWPSALFVVVSTLIEIVRLRQRRRERPPVRHGASKTVPARRWFQTDGARQALAVGLVLLGWTAVWWAFDARGKALAQIDYFTSRSQYEQVLAAAAQLDTMDSASAVRLHQALYHTGRLGQDLFSFPNLTAWNLMPALTKGLGACRPQSETLFELGHVSLAEHFAHEALESEGERPDLLRLLARVNILKDRPKAARVFLNVLSQVPFQREWAGARLRELDADPRSTDANELGLIRARMAASDLPHAEVPTDAILRQLLHANPRNQMAFEYLMAHYLLTAQVNPLVEELGRLGDFEYSRIPRHYEEAVLLYEKVNGRQVDL